jgi:hypothetical protein
MPGRTDRRGAMISQTSASAPSSGGRASGQSGPRATSGSRKEDQSVNEVAWDDGRRQLLWDAQTRFCAQTRLFLDLGRICAAPL